MSNVTVFYGASAGTTIVPRARQLNITVTELGSQSISGTTSGHLYDWASSTAISGTSNNPVTLTVTDGLGATCTISALPGAQVNLSGNSIYPLASGDFPVVIITSPTQGNSIYRRPWQFTGTVTTSYSWRAGSFGEHVTAQMTAMISGKTASPIYYNTWTSNPYNGQAVVRNPTLFCAGYDTTGMAIWAAATGGPDYSPPCLISPQHAITCTHWLGPGGGGGTFVFFQGVNGTLYTRQRSVNYVVSGDFSIMALDSPLPVYGDPANTTGDGVTPFQVLPDDFSDYVVQGGNLYLASLTPETVTLPLLTKFANYNDRFGIQHTYDFHNYAKVTSTPTSYNYRRPASTSPFYAWCPFNSTTGTPVYPGDSGSPDFFPVNGKLVLLATHNTPASSPDTHTFNAAVQAAMDSLVTGYTLQKSDLSGFTKFTSP